MDTLAKLLGALIIVAAIMVLGCVLGGWVLQSYWYWFVLPAFKNAPRLTYIQCIGLSIFVNMIFKSFSSEKQDKDEETWVTATTAILRPFIAILLGWVVYICLNQF